MAYPIPRMIPIKRTWQDRRDILINGKVYVPKEKKK